MAKAKGTKVTEAEKRKMYEFWRLCGSIKLTAKKFRRNTGTVSKYVNELDTAQAISNYLLSLR